VLLNTAGNKGCQSYLLNHKLCHYTDDVTQHTAGKHFAAYDVETIPVDRGAFNARITGKEFWEFYLPAFHDCIAVGGSQAVMTALNQINGVPASATAELLDGVLRRDWEWDGFIVTDFGEHLALSFPPPPLRRFTPILQPFSATPALPHFTLRKPALRSFNHRTAGEPCLCLL
jgi:hypothetical protein